MMRRAVRVVVRLFAAVVGLLGVRSLGDEQVSARVGALFAVHDAPSSARGECGAVREHYGIQRVEATLQALENIAASEELLPGARLGVELRDSCWAAHTALRQTIDLVRDAIALPSKTNASKELGGAPPLVGVLGPGASSAAAHVQNLLQLFDIPQVSYSATSSELSDRARYPTFHRVLPSDLHQARAMVALLLAHSWTYVHAIRTDESYGQSGMSAFRAVAAREGVCVAREEALRAQPTANEVRNALRRLAGETRVRVAVCWCEGRTARAVLKGLARLRPRTRLLLLGSDGWADRRDVVAGLERVARGSMTLRVASPYLLDFDAYYHSLRPQTNTRNPWFNEFWEQKFNCSLAGVVGKVRCSGEESLSEQYTQEPKLALVVRGVYALAHALHRMRTELCGAEWRDGLCLQMLPFNVSLYRSHLGKVDFIAPDGARVAFDRNGDPPSELSEYEVMRLSRVPFGGGWRYERMGWWRDGELFLSEHVAKRAHLHEAACSRPCAAGWWAREASGDRARCCWTCVRCARLAITRAPPQHGCLMCPPGTSPDTSRTVCTQSPVEIGGTSRWAQMARGVSCVVGVVGVATASSLGVAMWRHRHTPAVRSTSRELCTLLLLCAATTHVAALAAAAPPAPLPCAAPRLAAPALAGVYAAQLARTVRLVRVVAAAMRLRAPSLASSRAQLCAWCALTAPAVALAAWGWGAQPPRLVLVHPGRWRSVLACGGAGPRALLMPLAPASALLMSATAMAIRARRLPRQYRETKSTAAGAYAACVLWAAGAPLLLAAPADARSPVLTSCASLCALATSALALGPRAFLASFHPELNTRDRFRTASSSLRCHVGVYHPPKGVAAVVAQPQLRHVTRAASTQTTPSCCVRLWEVTDEEGQLRVHIALLPPAHHHTHILS